jgi:hypothetical protein
MTHSFQEFFFNRDPSLFKKQSEGYFSTNEKPPIFEEMTQINEEVFFEGNEESLSLSALQKKTANGNYSRHRYHIQNRPHPDSLMTYHEE